jgi:hypothetical protein
MIAVLLLGLLLVLGILALIGYLLFFRSSPPPQAGDPRPAPTTAPTTARTTAPASTAPGTTRPSGTGEPGPGPPEPSSSGDTEALRSVARDYVTAVNDQDNAAATALTCEHADPGSLYSVTGDREVRLGDVEILEGAVGTAQVRVGEGEAELLFEKQEDGWCVAI